MNFLPCFEESLKIDFGVNVMNPLFFYALLAKESIFFAVAFNANFD